MTASQRLSRPSRIAMWVGLGLGLAFVVVFGVVPTLANVVVSFTDYSGVSGIPASFIGVTNYTTLFTTQRPALLSSVLDTVYFVVGVTVVQNAVAMLFAHRLRKDSRHATLLRILVFAPLVLGVTVVGIVWLLFFEPASGPGSAIFGAFGVHSAFFGSNATAMPLLIAAQVWYDVGFTTVIFIGGLNAIPREIYEAASLDGVTTWRRFTAITWPLMAPVVSVTILLTVITSSTTFNLIYILTDGQFGTNTLGILAFNTAFGSSTGDLGQGAAVSTVLLVLTVLVAVPLAGLLQYRERRLLG